MNDILFMWARDPLAYAGLGLAIGFFGPLVVMGVRDWLREKRRR